MHISNKAIRDLLFKIRNYLSDGTITDSELYTVRKEYNRIIARYGNSYLYRSQIAELKRVYETFRCRYCAESSTISLPMNNFLSTGTTGYPVGVFNINGTFLGTADDSFEFVGLWNADPSNQAQGELLVSGGLSSTTFLLPNTATITEVRGLRYYEYTGPANLQLFVGPNDIVRYGSTQKKGSVDGVSITTTTRREWNRNLFSGIYKSTIPADTVYTLNCTGYTDSSSLKVFHNEDSEYAAVSFSNGFYTIAGNYPLGLKAVFYAGRIATNYNNILNWSELTSFFSWYSLSSGGAPWGIGINSRPTTLLTNNVTQLGLGELTSEDGPLTADYSDVTATNYPALQDLVILYNTGDALTGGEAWFLTMPKVTNYLRYRTQTLTQASAAVADAVWNNVWTALSTVTPVGAAKQLRIERTNNITAASLTARNNLIAAGWTVTTN